MARQARYDLAQTGRPRKLAVEQRNELSLGRQPPYPRIGTVIFHKSVEPIPRNMLKQPVKYADAAWLDPFPCPKRRQTLGTQKNQRHAPCPQKTNRTAVGLSRPSTSFLAGPRTWIPGTRPRLSGLDLA